MKERDNFTTEQLLQQLINIMSEQKSNIEHITLSAFCEKIEGYYKQNRAFKTFKSVQTSCGHMLRFFALHILINNLSIRQAQEFINYLQKQAPAGVYVYYRTLKAVFNIAKDWNYIESNPFLKVKLPRRQKNEVVTVRRSEVDKIVKAVNNEILQRAYIFAFLTGVRAGELTALKWSDVNLSDKYLTIGGNGFITKSKRNRKVPLSKAVVRILTELKPKIVKLDGYVFCKSNGYPYSTDYLSKQFKKAVREVGLDEKIHLHTLRAGYATHLAESGVSLQQIKELLGHKDYKTTLRYASVSLDTLREAVRKAFD